MKSRLSELIAAQLRSRKSADLKRDIAKTENATYDRMFDSLTVLDDETCNTVAKMMLPIVNAFVAGFVKEVPGFNYIVRHDANNFLDMVGRVEAQINPKILQDKSDYVHNQINTPGAIQQRIKRIVDKLIDSAFVQILDGRGNLRWDLVQQLGLNDSLKKSKAIRDPQIIALIVSGYFSVAVAQVAEKLTASVDSRERKLAGHVEGLGALLLGLREIGSVAAIKEKIIAIQKLDREHAFATGFVEALLAKCSMDFPAYKETLVILVQADFDKFHDNDYLQKPENKKLSDHLRIKKLSFWLDVMFQLITEKKLVIFSAIFDVFENNLRMAMAVEEKSVKGQKGLDHQLLEKHPDKLDCYTLCLDERDEYENSLCPPKESDYDEDEDEDDEEMLVDISLGGDQKPLVISLQRFLDAHDCYLAIDLVVQSFMNPGRLCVDERAPAEFELLEKWIEISQSNGIFDCGSAATLLNNAYKTFCSNRHSVASETLPKAGMLEEVLNRGKNAFSGHLLTKKRDSLSRIKSISAAMQISCDSLSSLGYLSLSDDEEQRAASEPSSPRTPPSVVVPSTPVRVLFNQAVPSVADTAGPSVLDGVRKTFS